MAKKPESLPPPPSHPGAATQTAQLPAPLTTQYEIVLNGRGRGRRTTRYAVDPKFAAAVAFQVVAALDAPHSGREAEDVSAAEQHAHLNNGREGDLLIHDQVPVPDGRFADDGVHRLDTVAEDGNGLPGPVARRRRPTRIDESRIFPGLSDDRVDYADERFEVAVPDEGPPVPVRSKAPRAPKAPKTPKTWIPEPPRTQRAPAARGKRKHWWEVEITPKKVKPVELMNFSRQASSFIRAGIPVIDALETIAQDSKDKVFKSVLINVAERIRSGAGFGDALGAQTVAFPPYFVSMVRSAELTGRLDDVLDQLASYMQRDLDTKRKVKSALTYPSVVAVTGVGTVVTLTVYVLPKFKQFFKELHAKLPLTTRMLLRFSDLISAYGLIAGAGCVALLVALFGYMKTESGRLRRDTFFLRIPVVGTLVQYVAVERFCRGLSALVSAGVPLPDAMKVASDTTANRKFIGRLKHVRERLIKGEGLAQPIADTGLFPPAASQMIRVGEATGTLDTQLDSASEFYEREVGYRLKKFTDMFEPLMIIGMGVMVGFVALALVQAMYGVFDQVK